MRVDAEALALHQREFGRDVEAVGGEQEHGEEQVEERARSWLPRHATFSARKSTTRRRGTSAAMNALPMPRVRMNVSLPRDDLLVLRDEFHQALGGHAGVPGMSPIAVGSPTSFR